jgi:hypothetical protein
MAGDWIPMRCDLADDPAVIAIAAFTDLDIDSVVGKLHRLWAWANRQTTDGNARGVTEKWIDAKVGQNGFALAMQNSGWLKVTKSGVQFPSFDSWNSQGAKQRQLTARRVAAHKAKNGNAATVSGALPKEEKRTDKKNTFTPPTIDEIRDYCQQRKNSIDAEHFEATYARQGWKLSNGQPMKDWRKAVVTWEKNNHGGRTHGNRGGGNASRSAARVNDTGLLAQLDAEEAAAAGNAGSGPIADAGSGLGTHS